MKNLTTWAALTFLVLFLPTLILAQSMNAPYGMCPMGGMGGVGMVMWLVFWLLLVALMVTAFVWMIKQIKKA